MDDLLHQANLCLLHSQSCELCTIIESKGSTPQGKGARMLVTQKAAYGTIGGGAIELLCTRQARDYLDNGMNTRREFNLDGEIGMVCGGDVVVEFTYIKDQEDIKRAFGEENKRPVAYIFGAGHVAMELCPLLEHLGWDVVVYDDRSDMPTRERFGSAKTLICASFDNIGEQLSINKDDYVVIMTHGHEKDRAVLLQVLGSQATYVGCIGSRHKVAKTAEFLIQNGIAEKDISRVHSPIGLEIYGNEPAEIAISIAAEMIRHRAVLGGLDKR